MGSRKDLIKRSLAITEYPWSSDDELEAVLTSETAATDTPGTSGTPQVASQQTSQNRHLSEQQQEQQQQQQSTARRNQARQDREIFWSIINSPYRVANQNSRTRSNEVPVPRVTHVPAPGAVEEPAWRATRAADLQRIMEFRRISRSLGPLRHRSYLTGIIPVTRVNPGVIVPSEANSSIIINRHQPSRTRNRTVPTTSPSGRNGRIAVPSTRSTGAATAALVAARSAAQSFGRWDHSRDRDRERDRERDRDRNRDRDRGHGARAARDPRVPAPTDPGLARPDPDLAHMLIHSEEDEVNNNPSLPAIRSEGQLPSTLDEAVDEQDPTLEEPPDVDLSTNTNVALEEEIVAIDLDSTDASTQIPLVVEANARASTSAVADTSDQADGPFRTDRLSGGRDTTAGPSGAGASGDAGAAHSSRPSKRSRRDSIESIEPSSVKEFNQNLLRLLECPVCLEWMEPPMSQCRRGHLVCGRCRARLASCPVCRTTFSSVRNRAMEGVAELLRYPCRHGCGREVRLRRRAPHEASCASRNYHCPAPLCNAAQPLPRDALAQHFQSQHLTMMKIGRRHKFSMKVNSEQHDNWLIFAMQEYFHLKIDVDIRTWGVAVYVSFIGPKCDANNYTYEVSIDGQDNQRKLVYSRTTHSDLESSTLNVSRQDCFHLTLDQALNFIRFKNRHCDTDKCLDFNVEITKVEQPAMAMDDSDS